MDPNTPGRTPTFLGQSAPDPEPRYEIEGQSSSAAASASASTPACDPDAAVPEWYQPLGLLPSDVAHTAKVELKEDPDTRLQLLWDLRRQCIKHRIKIGVPGSGIPPTDEWLDHQFGDRDVFLMAFLRVSKMNVIAAVERCRVYSQLTEELGIRAEECTWNRTRDALETGMTYVLPSKDKKGRAVSVFALGKASKRIRMRQMQKAMQILNEEVQVNGFVVIDDFRNALWSDFNRMTKGDNDDPKVMLRLMKDGFPLRLKGIIVLYPPWFVNLLLGIAMPFMKKKIQNRIHVVKDSSELYEFFDSVSVPKTLDKNGTLDFSWEDSVKREIERETGAYREREFIQIVIHSTEISNGVLGWTLSPDEASGGVLVVAVDADSVASRLNIRENDVIFEVDDVVCMAPQDVNRALHPTDWLGRAIPNPDVTVLLRREVAAE